MSERVTPLGTLELLAEFHTRIADLERQLAEARADADLAVALAVQKAADQVSMSAPGRWLVVETDRVKAAILALAPATALAEVQALRAERAKAK